MFKQFILKILKTINKENIIFLMKVVGFIIIMADWSQKKTKVLSEDFENTGAYTAVLFYVENSHRGATTTHRK